MNHLKTHQTNPTTAQYHPAQSNTSTAQYSQVQPIPEPDPKPELFGQTRPEVKKPYSSNPCDSQPAMASFSFLKPVYFLAGRTRNFGFGFFWCTFYRPKQCDGVPKLTNIRYVSKRVLTTLPHVLGGKVSSCHLSPSSQPSQVSMNIIIARKNSW